MGRRLGVLGGTFDPPHHGHLIVAADAFEALSLDQVVFVPAGIPPHKEGGVVASGEERVRMLEAAIAGDDRFAVNDLELSRRGPSYTVDTLREIQRDEPDAELFFILGVDQFKSLANWREPGEVARLATLSVLARNGETPDLSGPYPARLVPTRCVDISATEVRKRLAQGEPVRYLIPEAVESIIRSEGLYLKSPS